MAVAKYVMALSQTALQAVLAQQTHQVFHECLVVSHVDLSESLYLVNDRVDLIRSSATYTAFPFTVQGMRQSSDQLPSMRVVLDNVDQRIITTLRTLAGTRTDITVTYDVVLDETPNTIEYGPIDFRVSSVNVSPSTISLDLVFHSGFLDAAFPAGQFAPSNAE